uniref:Malonyl-CoA:ACP transacylase (MAT) domain-containing protein n=1 Tax=Romanomermis culicivorax TaxID=13658 RepID=A0A915IQV0_ROMCU
MAAAYCDGCMTAEETILCAYYRGKSILDANLPVGAMAAVGLTWQEVQQRLPPSLDAACHNSNDSVTISGAAEDVKKFVEILQSEKIFAKMVNSSGIPFHSRHLKPVAKAMRNYLNKLIPSPRLRSSRWISSSVKESEWETKAKYCSPDYHLNNILSPVLFREALSKIPENSVIVEIAPHCLLQAVIKRTVPSTCQSFGLMKSKHEFCLDYFLTSLGHIYQCGINLEPQRLLGPVSFPVPVGTPMVSPAMVWDHSQSWPVMSAGDAMITGGQGSKCQYTIDPFPPESKDAYILDHVIDGRVLFPFTGYLELVWKTICRMRNLDYQKTPVLFENVSVYRPTLMSRAVKFGVTVSTVNGDFEIIESDSLAASGRITISDEDTPFYYDKVEKYTSDSKTKNEKIQLLTPDVYKEMLLRGYEYGPKFRSIIKADRSGIRTQIKWTGNWVTFLDAMLQCAILAEHASTLKLP